MPANRNFLFGMFSLMLGKYSQVRMRGDGEISRRLNFQVGLTLANIFTCLLCLSVIELSLSLFLFLFFFF